MSFISDEKKLYQRLKALSDVFLLPDSKPLDYKSILRTVTKHFKVFTEADASVLMLNDNNENLTPVFSIGIPFSKIKDSTLPLSTRLKDIVSRPVLDVRYSSFMNTPLIHNRKLIGLSAVFSTIPEYFHTFERDKYNNLLLTVLASYFAVSIENVTLSDSMKSTERFNEEGKCAGTIHIASDVTEQRKSWNQAIQRVIIIVLDGVGVGAMPDAHLYGDEGSNTLGNIADVLGGLQLPNLERLGLGRIIPIKGISPSIAPSGFYGKMSEISAGKDTTSGHWEMTGVITKKPFPTYPNGFPKEIINTFTNKIGRSILGNKPASGTEIIQELGKEHIETGFPIVYTSADSVFQIAACEDIIPIPELYKMCETAREILTGEHAVGRVIARPFVVKNGQFIRTDRRKDFSLAPPSSTVLDHALQKGLEVVGIGKIGDIFAHTGLSEEIHTHDNQDGITQTIKCVKRNFKGILITNLVDFDMKYGHRNDVTGYADALKTFDNSIPEILETLGEGDILFITADHGCDPTTLSTDHSREYVPLLVYGKVLKSPASLGIRQSFADLGTTVAEILNLRHLPCGQSFYKNLF
ncbi:MAG: phosphopentomutase [Candidatus Brocadiaceae bacterium]|nr:phosphopentomutase [Candidatus Brocadiaceae bacterium]